MSTPTDPEKKRQFLLAKKITDAAKPMEAFRRPTPTNTSIKPHPSTIKTMKKTPMQLAQQVTFTVQEAAKITGRSPKTIRRHCNKGALKAAGGGRGTPYRISRPDLEAWWREQGGGVLFEPDSLDETLNSDTLHPGAVENIMDDLIYWTDQLLDSDELDEEMSAKLLDALNAWIQRIDQAIAPNELDEGYRASSAKLRERLVSVRENAESTS